MDGSMEGLMEGLMEGSTGVDCEGFNSKHIEVEKDDDVYNYCCEERMFERML